MAPQPTADGHEPVMKYWDECVTVTPGSAVFVAAWGLTVGQAKHTARALMAATADASFPLVPWAMVVVVPDGRVVAATSTAYTAGMYWSETTVRGASALTLGPFLGAVIRARAAPTHLDDSFAAAKFGVAAGPTPSTPFHDVHRAPAGVLLTWNDLTGPPRQQLRLGKGQWPDPTLRGPDLFGRYLRTFDEAVSSLAPTAGPLCATMSGGLDSTFVVSSLVAHARADRPVIALVHSPNPAASLRPRNGWDPDDYPIARAMQAKYPHLVEVRRVVNDPDARPLAEAVRSATRLWYPTPNIANHLWLRKMDDVAQQMGATRLFGGGQGNAAFSDSHMYAAAYHAQRGEWREVLDIARPYRGQRLPGVRTGPALLLRQTASGIRHARGDAPPRHSLADYVPAARPVAWTVEGTPRYRYLRMLRGTDHRATVTAFAGWQVPRVDPFATAGVMDLAAAIQPSAWARAGTPRGFARRLAMGRLPDEIRLRTRRGGQSWDLWFTIHRQGSDFFEAADALLGDPTLGQWVDADALMTRLRGWPWGTIQAERPEDLFVVVDMLCYATAWRTLRAMVGEASSA